MLSILIPTYNEFCVQLVRALKRQADGLSGLVDYEILVGDDGSTDPSIQQENGIIDTWDNCRYILFPQNAGSARTRNLLADLATGEYLMFIDADATVNDKRFLKTYVEASQMAIVVCGGIENDTEFPEEGQLLRYFYEQSAARFRTVAFRQAHPYAYFTTFNFLIRRDTFLSIRFDERCVYYGYEDTVFGLELKKRNISVLHIDNPLVHTGIDQSRDFLTKTEAALRNLSNLDSDVQEFVKISRLARRLKRYGLLPLMKLFHLVFAPLERWNLCSTYPLMCLFRLYKLGAYCRWI